MSLQGFASTRIVTCTPERGTIENGVVVFDEGAIVYVGRREGTPSGATIVDVGDRVITPGLVDAHTHSCWVGSRHAEYAVRMAGGDYRAIAEAGGGILSTQRAVAGASEDVLVAALLARLARMAALGVTTIECKSGYGLRADLEKRQLRAIARAAASSQISPSIVSTFLALHALPPGVERGAYVEGVAGQLVAEVASEKLASFVDAYVDANAFTTAEARRVCEAAIKVGLRVRLHVGQFADVGGAELAAELGALSVDHLEHVSAKGIASLSRASVAVVLLPLASFTLAQEPPPISQLRDAGVRLVVASDANPGTAPTESLPLAMALAVRSYSLSPDEVILAATRDAALSLGLSDRGVLEPGKRADLVVWDLPHESAIVQPWGTPKTYVVVIGGRERRGETSIVEAKAS